MPVLDNSPSKNRIRWCDVQVIYKKEVFKIKNGDTDKMYVYWDLKNPDVFKSSNELPYEYIGIVFVNNNGIHTVYPNTDISVVDVGNSRLKFDHLDKSISSIRQFTTLLDERISSIEEQIVSIREMLVNINNRITALESPSEGK